MKIRLAYLPEEEQEAAAALAALRSMFPRSKVRRSAAHPPFIHTYLTVRRPENRSGFSES